MPTLNYVFGAYSPTLQSDAVAVQMLAAHRYRNKLCELEITRRAAADQAARDIHPEYASLAAVWDAAQQVVDDLYAGLRAANAKARRKVPISEEQTQAITDAKATVRDAYEAMKDAKKEAYKRLQETQAKWREPADAAIALIEKDMPNPLTPTARKRMVRDEYLRLIEAAGIGAGQQAYESSIKSAREHCGCYWGTYLTIEDACSKFHIGPPPRFLPYTGDGTIAVQLQGGLSIDDAIAGNDTRLQLVIPNQEELSIKGRSRGLRARGLVRMRIGSDGRSPIFAEFPVIWHRPIPSNAVIKWAYMHRRRVATHDEWSLRLTVEIPVNDTPSTGSGIVAIHPGYRTIDGRIRVASIVDQSGVVEELFLPAGMLGRFEKSDSLQKIRDRTLNRNRPRLVKWLKSHESIIPEWLKTESETLYSWTAQSRFYRLAIKWRDNRFAGDEIVFALFERWRKHDKHLYDWQEHQHLKAANCRRDYYRCFAERIAEKYAHVVIPKIDWKQLREKPGPDEEHTQTNHQRRISSVAAPGMMVGFIREKCAGKVIDVPAKHITGECHACGQIDKWDRSRRDHTCTKCGVRWDQDHNAVRVTLARGIALRKSPAPLADEAAQRVSDDSTADGDAVGPAKKPTARKSRRNRKAVSVIE